MKVNSKKIVNMVKENLHIQMKIYLMVNSKIIREMEKVFIYLKMVQNMKDYLRMVKNVVKEN